jgi:hypothetical protein
LQARDSRVGLSQLTPAAKSETSRNLRQVLQMTPL